MLSNNANLRKGNRHGTVPRYTVVYRGMKVLRCQGFIKCLKRNINGLITSSKLQHLYQFNSEITAFEWLSRDAYQVNLDLSDVLASVISSSLNSTHFDFLIKIHIWGKNIKTPKKQMIRLPLSNACTID